ncbi:hypothetical protein SYNPS1DRAFT_17398 [Syncephalis pseudoplumigaleata]|uniref:Uncharacterized protein n=1 Tax=Syncephalis pseudoplumigaleata TaxID=1712513 RepID=A0A4P9YW71_9FUNG|nr:hypothetical protein SYNPS1DRAFT_17398 [Syncephalis pseudoplumigaleata]|eukprot:RKP24306.1 hypothetical protein SYNPS1DRAFT_17398 [Syncephalis pseudoplumigaleata]
MQRVRLFHGTAFTCQLASKAVTHLCTRKCEGCNIVRMSFRLAYIGKNRRRTKWQRLGNGIYFSPHASKCHFYSGTGVRGMFLADVVLGRSYKPSTMELERLCPPPGYHSSYGEAGKCGLNYDEYAVFDEVACLPLLLYVYSYTSTTE